MMKLKDTKMTKKASRNRTKSLKSYKRKTGNEINEITEITEINEITENNEEPYRKVTKISSLWGRLFRCFRSPSLVFFVSVTLLPMTSAIITYFFIFLPDNSIHLDLKGSLIAVVVIMKIILLGSLGILPLDLDDLLTKRFGSIGRRSPRDILQRALEDDMPCTVRIFCEMETAARTAIETEMGDYEDQRNGTVDSRGQTEGDGDRLEGTLIDPDHIGIFHGEGIRALFREPGEEVLSEAGREALGRLASITGEGHCETAYIRCSKPLTAKSAMGVLFEEVGVRAGMKHRWLTPGISEEESNSLDL